MSITAETSHHRWPHGDRASSAAIGRRKEHRRDDDAQAPKPLSEILATRSQPSANATKQNRTTTTKAKMGKSSIFRRHTLCLNP
jgi:hypothetical protein